MSFVKAAVCVTQENSGLVCARVVDGPEGSAIATTAKLAIQQLEKYLNWLLKEEEMLVWSALTELTPMPLKVAVRLQYQSTQGRRQPLGEPIEITVNCLIGRHSDGNRECILPDLQARFFVTTEDNLRDLVTETVRGRVTESMRPDAVLPWVAPEQTQIHWLRLRVPKEHGRPSQTQVFPALSLIADPISNQSKRGDRLVLERDFETAELLLELAAGNSMILVGESGAGRSCLVRDAALKWQRKRHQEAKSAGETVPPPLVWQSNASAIISGMQYLGQWEERLESVIGDLSRCDGYLWLDQLIDLVRTGGSGAGDSIAAFLVPYLERREVRLIVETTPAELDACRRLLPGFAELFRLVSIKTMSLQTTRKILDEILARASRDDHCEVEDGAADLVTRLHKQFMPYHAPPRGPVQFVRDAVQRLKQIKETSDRKFTRDLVLQRFSLQTGLPEWLIRDEMPLDQATMNAWFTERVHGQPAAVLAACNTINRIKAGLQDPLRPLRVMFFSGPTGVGKTQLAKALGAHLLSAREEKQQVVRLDMSEYSGPGAADRLLMDDRGEPASWIRRVRHWPFGIILFDEIEKASSTVFDVLLGLLDEGRLTDRLGRTTSFASTIVIMTSNVGVRSSSALGFGDSQEADTSHIRREMRRTFRPEFLNRIDDIVAFSPLTPEVTRGITQKELHSLAKREGLSLRGVHLQWSDRVVDHLASVGFHAQLGARPLQRAVEQVVVAPLSRWLVEHHRPAPLRLSLDWRDQLVIDEVRESS